MKWLSLLLLFFSCTPMKQSQKTNQTSIHDIYVLESVGTQIVKGKITKESTLEINLTNMQIMGVDGCNEFSGQITQHNASKMELSFDEIMATEMYCDELSNKVGQSFDKVKKYKRDGLLLKLFSGKDELLLTYKKVD